MKRLSILSLAIFAIALYGCKKEEEDPKTFLQNKLIGAWPIKYNIRTIFIDNVEQAAVKGDTITIYNPIDTLVFTAEGQAIKRNKNVISTVGYSISADGESITFNTTPATTQKITFVRVSSIGLGTETVTQIGNTTKRTVLADYLIK